MDRDILKQHNHHFCIFGHTIHILQMKHQQVLIYQNIYSNSYLSKPNDKQLTQKLVLLLVFYN